MILISDDALAWMMPLKGQKFHGLFYNSSFVASMQKRKMLKVLLQNCKIKIRECHCPALEQGHVQRAKIHRHYKTQA